MARTNAAKLNFNIVQIHSTVASSCRTSFHWFSKVLNQLKNSFQHETTLTSPPSTLPSLLIGRANGSQIKYVRNSLQR